MKDRRQVKQARSEGMLGKEDGCLDCLGLGLALLAFALQLVSSRLTPGSWPGTLIRNVFIVSSLLKEKGKYFQSVIHLTPKSP